MIAAGATAPPGLRRTRPHPHRRGCGISEVGSTIGVVAVATAMIRASGPVALGGRDLPPRIQGVIALLAPALLAALVVVETFGAPAGGPFELDARGAGSPPPAWRCSTGAL